MDYDTLLKNFDELNEQVRKAKQEMQDKSKGLIETAVKRFLDTCPEVKGVHWTQYTPYFKDGEACEFSVNEFCFHLEGEEPEAYESSQIYTTAELESARKAYDTAAAYESDRDGWINNYIRDYEKRTGRAAGLGQYIRPYPDTTAKAQERIDEIEENLAKYGSEVADRINAKFKEFMSAMSKIPDDIMETVYGDHVMVVITRDGTEIDEYHHD